VSYVRRKRVGWAGRLASGLRGKEKMGRKARPAGENRPKKVLKNSKDFSISYFDSNSNLIRILNEFYMNLTL
jgi:hypothetical protein